MGTDVPDVWDPERDSKRRGCAVTMPSQSIHIPEDDYEYGITTKANGQSTSARFAELVAKGRRYEEEIENGDD